MRVKLIQMTQNPIDVMWVAARTCYSEKSPIEMWNEINKDNMKFNVLEMEKHWNLVKKVLDSGHSCYDNKTEVLTSEGFKLWGEVTENDLIAAIEPMTHKMHYEKPKRLVKSDYIGKMYFFNNKYINLCVTPNHRLYSSLISKIEDRKVENFDFYKCKDIVYKENRRTNVEVALRPQKFKTFCETTSAFWYNPLCLSEDKVEAFDKLIGFFIGDGYAEGGNRLEFHLKKERKVKYLKDIVETLGWEFKECKNNKYKVFVENIGNFARDNYYDNNFNKRIPDQLLTCSQDCINAFIDGLKNSDGSHHSRNSFTYSTTSEQVADLLQALVHIVGGHASIKIIKDNQVNKNWKQCIKMEVCVPNTRPYVLVNDSRHVQKDVNIIDYEGAVYCCEVSTGLLMVRRNNKVCLCGNSVAEHVYFTFAIEGISRACSHQLVRHRAGIVFSQQSQRYVEIKEDVFNLLRWEEAKPVLDKYFTDVNTSNWQEYLDCLKHYLHHIQMGMKPEDARMILPNATKTNITMSCNLRELMHMSSLRLCSRASLEIRNLFKAIREEVKTKDERLSELLVPSCEANKGICFEAKSCGRKPTVQEVLKDYNEGQS